MIDLLGCPFCGNADIRFTRHVHAGSGIHYGEDVWSMCCYTCGASVPNRYEEHGRKIMVDAWNRRALSQSNPSPLPVDERHERAIIAELAKARSEFMISDQEIARRVLDAIGSHPCQSNPVVSQGTASVAVNEAGTVAIPDGWQLVPWKCAARNQGTSGGNDPADCNWPICGCDPHADKVIAALQESGLFPQPAAQEPVAVKALPWAEWTNAQRGWQANTVLGQYQVAYLGEHEAWQLFCPGKSSVWSECFSLHPASDAAKAAAKSDYETRIRSALSPPREPAPQVVENTAALKAEIERLREALSEVLPMAEDHWANPENIPEIMNARAALASKETTDV